MSTAPVKRAGMPSTANSRLCPRIMASRGGTGASATPTMKPYRIAPGTACQVSARPSWARTWLCVSIDGTCMAEPVVPSYAEYRDTTQGDGDCRAHTTTYDAELTGSLQDFTKRTALV